MYFPTGPFPLIVPADHAPSCTAELLLLLSLSGLSAKPPSPRLGPQWVCFGGRKSQLLIKGEGRSFLSTCTSVLGGLLIKSASAFPLQFMNRKEDWGPSPHPRWC